MTKKNFIILALSGILLLGFLVLTISAKYDLTQKIDFDTTVRIQDKMPERLKPYLIKIVELGSWQIMSVIVFATMLIQRKNFWKIGILFIIIVLIEVYGKANLQHPPPPQFMLLRFEHLNLPTYYVRENVASYPSGHAARPAFLMMVWIPYLAFSLSSYIKRHRNVIASNEAAKQPGVENNLQIKLPFGFILTRQNRASYEIIDFSRIALFLITFGALAGFTFLVGFTKVYLGEHWISDVVGGWLLGAGLGLLIHLKLPAQKSGI